jgi:hypothetical protein
MFSTVPRRDSNCSLGVKVPAKDHPPELIQHGLVLHDIRRGHECMEDDASFAAIDNIVIVIPEFCRRAERAAHQSCVGIGGADT